MRNRYAATCYRCGKICEAGKGHFERHRRSWRVQHAECAIEWREKKQQQEAIKELNG